MQIILVPTKFYHSSPSCYREMLGDKIASSPEWDFRDPYGKGFINPLILKYKKLKTLLNNFTCCFLQSSMI